MNNQNPPEWAIDLIKEVRELKSQVGINCTKLDTMKIQLNEIKVIGTSNQNSINELIKINRGMPKK